MTILVAGVGNALFGDDGFGGEVTRQLALRPLPEGVRVADYGTRCVDLVLAMLEPLDFVILIDAILSAGVSGTLHVLELEEEPPADADEPAFELHSLEPRKLLRLARGLGYRGNSVFLLGCEVSADATGPTVGLSEPVQAVVPEAVRQIEALIRRMQETSKR